MNRTLKITNTGDGWKKEVKPQILLKGKWLLQAGFPPDAHVTVTPKSEGILEISLKTA